MDDFEIIALYHSRTERAIHETASKYGTLLYCIAKDVLKSHEDSEETVNDTYTGAWNAMPPTRPQSLRAFLCRMARNLAITCYRKHHAKKREGILVELSDLESGGDALDAAIDGNALTASIEQFLSSLPLDEQNLFVKRYFFALPLSDLALESESTVNQVSGRLFRLRKKLKKQLEQEGYIL